MNPSAQATIPEFCFSEVSQCCLRTVFLPSSVRGLFTLASDRFRKYHPYVAHPCISCYCSRNGNGTFGADPRKCLFVYSGPQGTHANGPFELFNK
jgi:hypothetical protein